MTYGNVCAIIDLTDNLVKLVCITSGIPSIKDGTYSLAIYKPEYN